jgi:diguanylate cyclase (GGDEF)-like protein/PAS domain S-box-containing protein
VGRWVPWAAGVVTAVIGLALTLLATTATVQRIDEAADLAARQSASSTAEALNNALWPMEAFNEAVRSYVAANPVGHEGAEAATFMSSLFERWRGFRSAALAPGNTVTIIVPRQANQAVVGLRYPDSVQQWPDIKRAIESRRPVLSGPFDLVQGGRGFAYRTPIFLSDGTYWGLVSSVIDVQRMVGPDVVAPGVGVVVRDVDHGGAVVVGDASIKVPGPSSAQFEALGRTFQVGVATVHPDLSPAVVVAVVGLLLTTLLAALVFLLMSSRQRTRHLLRLLVGVTSQAPGMLFQYRTRPQASSEMVFASAGLATVLGEFETGAVEYSAIRDRIHPDDLPAIEAAQQRAIEAGEPWTGTFRVILPDGRTRWIRTSARPEVEANGEVVWSGWSGDVTDDMAEANSLRVSASLFAATRDGVVVLDADRRVTDVNLGLTSMTGYAREDVIGQHLSDYLGGAMADESMAEFWAQLDGHGYWRGELSGRDSDGRIRTNTASATAVRDEAGRLSHYLIVLDDLNIARDDSVTGLPGARTLDDEFRAAMAAADETGDRSAIIILALEQFRQVNESFGHRTGDAVLRVVGQRLRATVPPASPVVRLRGDEFAILLPSVDDLSVVDRVARECLDAVEGPIEIDRLVIRVSAKAGVTVYPDDVGGPTELAAHANQAMRAAKASDAATVVYFSPQMLAEAQARTLLVEDLLRALRKPAADGGSGEFMLVFQPVVDTPTGEVHRAEALVRWNHPRRGVVSPDDFIPVAEETGLITDLGDVVFAEAMRAVEDLRRYDPTFRVGFNLSPVELRDGSDRHERRAQALAASDLPGDALVAEITEGVLLARNPIVEANLARYRNAGLIFAIDDFGTGYSSLAYLRDLDVDCLKIDRMFVDRLQPEGTDLALVIAIIAMARTLKIDVIAEGVETQEQAQLLSDAGCDFVQGYWYARPMPLPDLIAWLAARAATAVSPPPPGTPDAKS